MSNWSDLPVHILNLIAERLYYIDQIRFRAVCKSWRSNIYDDIKFADKLPWIMGYSGTKKIQRSLFYLYEPSQKRRYRLKNKILLGAELRASLHEWKLHPYPPVFKRPYQYYLSLIESPDDGNLILLSYNYNDPEWVFRFDQSQAKWFIIENFMSDYEHNEHEQVEVENLNNRIIYYALDNSICLPAEGEASKLANTIQSGLFSRWFTSGTHQSSCPQIYDWVDEGADPSRKVWIQPPQTR
ncbi:hypothetical protein ACOSQ2_015104 [Xanthoceras sorbifolium]